MTRVLEDKRLAAAAIALLLVVLLVAQAGTDALTPPQGKSATGLLLGRTSSAYLSGFRTFLAAVLWNPLDRQYDTYYARANDQRFLMPTLHLINTLDPQFTQPYYVASWFLAKRGKPTEGFALAQEGLRNNPKSGLLRVSYAQMEWLIRKDIPGAVSIAKPALSNDTMWVDAEEKYEGYAVMIALFKKAKLPAEEQRAQRIHDSVGRILAGAPARNR